MHVRRTGGRRRRVLPLLAAVLAVPLTVPLTASTPAVASPSIPAGTIDPGLQEELDELGDAYVDVLVVFESRTDFAVLERLEVPTRYYQHFPIARTVLTVSEVRSLAGTPGVLSVEANLPQPLHNAESRQLTGVDAVQGPDRPAELRYEGAGVHVAVIDTGVDGTHPALTGQVERAWLYASPSPEVHRAGLSGDPHEALADHDGRVYVSSSRRGIDVHQTLLPQAPSQASAQAGLPVVTDLNGHGTHVAGTLLGAEGPDHGVAPQARLHSYAMPAVGLAQLPVSFLVEAYDHLLRDPRIRIVNASVGLPTCTREGGTVDWYRRANQTAMRIAALEHGVLTVNSYGNGGMDGDGGEALDSCATLSLQPYVLGVGATTKGGRVWAASSRGPEEGNVDRKTALKNLLGLLGVRPGERNGWDGQARPVALARPGLMAPGARIVSTLSPGHGHQVFSARDDASPFYGEVSGTSMAAPHVAGVAALALEAHRRAQGKDLSALELIALLEASADRTTLFDYAPRQAGAGLVDAVRAVQLAESRRSFPSTEVGLVGGGGAATETVAAGTVSGQAFDRYTTAPGRGPSLHEVVVPDGAVRLTASVPPAQRSQLRISLFPPGADARAPFARPVADSGWSYFAVVNSLRAEAAFPAPGSWTLRVEAIAPPGGNAPSVVYADVPWTVERLLP